MRQLSDMELSVKQGFDVYYFAYLKSRNIEKYNFIFSFDKDKEKSIIKCKDHIEELLRRVGELYHDMEEKELLVKYIKETKIFASVQMMKMSIFFYMENPISTQYEKILKWKRIEEDYNKRINKDEN